MPMQSLISRDFLSVEKLSMPMQSLISRDFLSVEKFSGCLQLRWAVNFQLSLLPPSLGVTWKNKKNWACYLVVCLLRSFLRCTSEKKKGKAKGCSSVSPAASARFLERSILTLDPFYSLDLFGDALSVLQFYMWCFQHICVYCYNFWGAAPFVSPDHSFGFPFLSFSVWSWARSPPESAPWLSPRSSGTAIRRFPLLLFLFPCGCDSKISTVVVLIPLWFSCFCSPLWLILIDCSCALVL